MVVVVVVEVEVVAVVVDVVDVVVDVDESEVVVVLEPARAAHSQYSSPDTRHPSSPLIRSAAWFN